MSENCHSVLYCMETCAFISVEGSLYLLVAEKTVGFRDFDHKMLCSHPDTFFIFRTKSVFSHDFLKIFQM